MLRVSRLDDSPQDDQASSSENNAPSDGSDADDRRLYPPPNAAIHPDRSLYWVRRLAPVVLARKWAFAASTAAGLVATTAMVLVPPAVGGAIDAVGRQDSVTPYVVALAILAAVRFGFGFVYRFGLFRSAHRIENDLRNLMYERLTELSFDYWDRTQSGQIISRANTDVRSIQLLFAFGPLVAMQLVMLVIALVVMVAIDLGLTAVALAPLPAVFFVGLRLRNRIFPLSWVMTARQADVATIVDENIGGIRVVKAFAQERRQISALAQAARRVRWTGNEIADTRARHAPIMESLPRLGLALVLLYGGLRSIDGDLAIGHLVAFSTYVVMLATPFRMLGFILLQWERAGAAALRVFEVLDEKPSIVDPENPVELAAPAGRVVFDNVTFAYPAAAGARSAAADNSSDADNTDPDKTSHDPARHDANGAGPEGANAGGSARPVLDGLSFTVDAGETLAIVGATGSGKSTIARLLPRFYDVDGGAVLIDGHDVRTLSLRSLRSAVVAAADDPFLFAASVYDNTAFARPDEPPAELDRLVSAAIDDAAAAEFVQSLPEGLATVLGERGLTLSGGQRQRLALARTLLADPAVLILDDATSAIDTVVEERIHEALQRRRSSRTTILIAHRLSTIALADRVVFIDAGRVAATGAHHELLASEPKYAAILADPGTASTDAMAGAARPETTGPVASNSATEDANSATDDGVTPSSDSSGAQTPDTDAGHPTAKFAETAESSFGGTAEPGQGLSGTANPVSPKPGADMEAR